VLKTSEGYGSDMVRYKLTQQQFWKGVVNAGSYNGGSIPPTSTNREMADMQRYTCPTNNGGFT